MLAKHSLVVSMFVLEDDANLSRRAAAAVPRSTSHLFPSCGNCPQTPDCSLLGVQFC